MASLNSAEKDLPTYKRPELVVVEKDLKLMNDLLAGTRRMWDQSLFYIRKWKDEDESVYNIRRQIAKLYEGLARTLSAAIGMIHAKPPTIEWNQSETAMKEDWANIDTLGTKGEVFIKRFTEVSLRDGLGLILTDHTQAPDGVEVSAANEKELGLRPTWAVYERSSILSWRVSKVNNQLMTTQVVLLECAELPTGRFGVEPELRYRQLVMTSLGAAWILWRSIKMSPSRPEDFQRIGGGFFKDKNGKVKQRLPISVAYCGTSKSPMTATIPLLGVAWANLSHWQQSSNLRFYRELAAFPQPTVIGVLAPTPGANGTQVQGTLKLGPGVAVQLTAGGDFKWTELSGSSMKEVAAGIEEDERHMSQLGMSFLTKSTRQAETAEAKRLDATAENATLSTASQGIEDAINNALEDHAWYLGIEKAGAPVITLNRDYDSVALDAATMAVYVQAVRDAGLPVRLLLEAWQQGGRIPAGTDLQELEMEMLANQAQKEAEQQAIAEEKQANEKAKVPAAA